MDKILFRVRISSVVLFLGLLALVPFSHAKDARISLAIDTRALTLTVMQGASPVEVFENIAIGSNGATREKRLGDEKTPLGTFRVTEIRESERFVMFIAIDYPNREHIQRALEAKRITPAEYAELAMALRQNGTAPQTSSLGGHLGIHGLGFGDRYIHDNFNWTNGCIALTNAQLERLLQWVQPGAVVKIH